MPFQLSPGVVVKEVDLTTVVPSVATSVGGFAGFFRWGPVEQIRTISNEDALVSTFGAPTDETAQSFFTAANYLSYSNNLKVVRVVGSASKNAAANATANGVLIKNEDVYNASFASGSNAFGGFAAKYPGVLGNSLRVSMADSATFASWASSYKALFNDAPGTSDYTAARGGTNDELHVVVVDVDGKIGGVAGAVLETFPFVSKASDAKAVDGSSSYYKNAINASSKYVWWLAHPSTATNNWGSTASTGFDLLLANVTVNLSGGATTAPSDGNVITGFTLFNNEEAVDVNFLMTGASNATVSSSVISLAEARKDALAFVSPPLSAVLNNAGQEATSITTYRATLTSSSYAVMDSGWKYQYDKYNDVYRWIPLNGDIAGLCARTDLTNDPWWSPGGLNRGIIKNVVKLAYSPNKTDRDTLYPRGINPVVSFPGQGVVLYGDKTMLSRPSAFDRINVRRLFIVLEKAIATASKYSLFEFNDFFTRAQFVGLVEPYLRDVQGRRGITDFRVVCDETNNTPEVIDRNEFVASIFIKPARSINFITLNFVATRTGISFDEVIGAV